GPCATQPGVYGHTASGRPAWAALAGVERVQRGPAALRDGCFPSWPARPRPRPVVGSARGRTADLARGVGVRPATRPERAHREAGETRVGGALGPRPHRQPAAELLASARTGTARGTGGRFAPERTGAMVGSPTRTVSAL